MLLAIIEALSFNSLYGLLVSILTMCIMYWAINRFKYPINIFIYMLSRTLLGFLVTKFLVAITNSGKSVKLTLAEFIVNLVLGAIIVKLLEKFAYDKGYTAGVFVFLGVVIEAVIILALSLVLALLVKII